MYDPPMPSTTTLSTAAPADRPRRMICPTSLAAPCVRKLAEQPVGQFVKAGVERLLSAAALDAVGPQLGIGQHFVARRVERPRRKLRQVRAA